MRPSALSQAGNLKLKTRNSVAEQIQRRFQLLILPVVVTRRRRYVRERRAHQGMLELWEAQTKLLMGYLDGADFSGNQLKAELELLQQGLLVETRFVQVPVTRREQVRHEPRVVIFANYVEQRLVSAGSERQRLFPLR